MCKMHGDDPDRLTCRVATSRVPAQCPSVCTVSFSFDVVRVYTLSYVRPYIGHRGCAPKAGAGVAWFRPGRLVAAGHGSWVGHGQLGWGLGGPGPQVPGAGLAGTGHRRRGTAVALPCPESPDPCTSTTSLDSRCTPALHPASWRRGASPGGLSSQGAQFKHESRMPCVASKYLARP